MEAKNLRIGNLMIDAGGSPCRVTRVESNYKPTGGSRIDAFLLNGKSPSLPFQPIPVTEEWISKLGFDMVIKQGNGGQYGVYTLKGITYNTNHGWWWKHHLDVQPKYVHELQNLFFAITGEELELETDG